MIGAVMPASSARALTIRKMFLRSVSADSLLNSLHAFKANDTESVKVLGVDDFSFHRGKSFGTILVDLETHTTIDLLEDRSAQTLAKWLKKHPNIEIISRDRSKDYAKGSSEGAPQAQQVADRWHLLVNLSDVIEKWLERHRQQLVDPKDIRNDDMEALDTKPFGLDTKPEKSTNYFVKHQRIKLASRQKRLAQYQQANELWAKLVTA